MKAAFAAAASPEVRASSNLRRKVRTRERRAVLTSVRRAILRTAFLEPGVLAIRESSSNGSRPGEPSGENWRRGYTQGWAPGQRTPGIIPRGAGKRRSYRPVNFA